MPANVYLLTHKCGNNFIIDLFNRKTKTDNYIELKPDFPKFNYANETFYNIRCRNFKRPHTEKLFDLLGKEGINYFVFTRHPASFFRSATTYHLRGNEKWCRQVKQPGFGDRTFYEALHDCKSFGEQLVASMKLFGISNRLIENWVMNLNFLRDKNANVQQVKCEDIWQNESSLKEFHSGITHSGFLINFEQLLKASPVGIAKLKEHSTGEFKKNAFDGYDDFAKNFYDAYFKKYEFYLQY